MLPAESDAADSPIAEVDNVMTVAEDEPMEPRNDTLESVLERTVLMLDAMDRRQREEQHDLRADLRAFRSETSANFNHLRDEMNAGDERLRDEMRAGFERVDAKIEEQGRSFDAKLEEQGKRFDAKLEEQGKRFDAKLDEQARHFDTKLEGVNRRLDSYFRWLAGMIFAMLLSELGIMAKLAQLP
jgi:DNA anti-recombination protein RmuC